MTEPDPDRGHIDRSAPDVVALVVPGGDGAVLAEMAEGALDHVALLIGRGVEGGRAAAPAAAPQPVPDLVRGLGDSGLDLAAAQVAADRRAGVRLVARDRPSASRSRNSPAPLGRTGSLSAAGASRAVSTSAGGARRAPAACWCARTTVASTATVHPWPPASSHPARSRPRIISQVPSPDQRRCRL